MHNKAIRNYLCLLVTVAALFSSCEQKPQVLTNEESIAFAKELQNSIKRGEGEFLDNSFDTETFIKKMKLPSSKDAKGFGKGIMKKLNIGKQISSTLTDQDSFEFLKHYVKDGIHHVIFRLHGVKDGTLNYHDYELIKADDKTKIADVYIYLSGEKLTETMHNLFNSLLGKTDDREQQNLAGAEDVKEIKELVKRGKNAEAKKMYDALPAYLKKSRAVLLFDVLICSGLSNEEYSAAIKNFQEKFPNEPNMNLLMIDGYFLQKEYPKMLSAINALDSQINKDPLLDYYRYMSYNLMEDDKNARIYLTRLLKNMPDFQKGYQELIAVELEANNRAGADSLINLYRKKTKFNQEELNTLISYYE